MELRYMGDAAQLVLGDRTLNLTKGETVTVSYLESVSLLRSPHWEVATPEQQLTLFNPADPGQQEEE